MKHVAVLMGGWSAEREVSLRSGAASADALETLGMYRVSRVDVARDIASVLAGLQPDAALNMLHGPFGEDGCMQGLLELLDIPYSHSGVLASALAMHKPRAKQVLADAHIPVPTGRIAERRDAGSHHLMEVPYVVKPVDSGSSVGVYIVSDLSSPPPQELLAEDWPYGESVLVEEYIPGKELTCAVMGDRALGVIEIVSELPFYDYEAKYAPGGSRHILPAEIPPEIYESVRTYAHAAHQVLGCRGVSRADFRYDPATATLVCLEVNTQPGMTGTSLVPEMAAHAGITFPELVRWMVEDASTRR